VSVRHRTERRVKERRRGEKTGLRLPGQLWTGGLEAAPRIESLGVSHRLLSIYAFIETRRRYFRDQPLLHPDVTDQHLVIYYFEDWLKKYFFSYLQILEVSQNPFSSERVAYHSTGLLLRSSLICPHAVPRLYSHPASLSSGAGTKFTTLAREQACAFAYFLFIYRSLRHS